MGHVAAENPPEPAPDIPPERPAVTVETDRPALLAEAAAIAAEAPAPEPVATGAPPESPPPEGMAPGVPLAPDQLASEAAPAVRGLVSTLAETIAPNWEITRAESDRVGDALALVMAYWMPAGAIEPKYVALVSLAGSLYSVAGARRDASTGKWKPLRKPPEKARASSTEAPAANGAAAAPGALRL